MTGAWRERLGRAARGAAPTLVALFLAGCGALYTLPTDGSSPSAAAPGKKLELSAWLVFWEPLSYKSFEANVSRLSRVYPEAYSCQADGLPGRVGVTSPQDLSRTAALAHAHGVKVLGTMNNYYNGDFDRVRVQKFLHDPGLMEQHVQGLLALMRSDGLDGLDVDYENLEAQDRGAFTAFVSRLALLAHAEGKLVGVALHPKENEPGNWAAPQAQDWAALGAVVDFFHPMTYDYHWTSGTPGSIAPPDWVRSVATFAAGKVDPSKVELGWNSYGTVWRAKGETLTWTGFLQMQSRVGKATRDENTKELVLNFPGGEAWMPDAQTALPKLQAARDLGLRGMAMWVLGQEDPATWAEWDRFNGISR